MNHLYELKFNDDRTFTSKIRYYGIYSGQSISDLSGFHENSGNYVQDLNKLTLNSHQYTWWDSFYVGSQPKTVVKDEILYENCSFKITGDILELNYTTYPADAPVNTTRQFARIR